LGAGPETRNQQNAPFHAEHQNMKNIVYRLSLIIGLLVAPLAFAAKTTEQAYVDTYRGRTDMPVPLKVVTPSVDADFAGQTVQVEFTVDASGVPQHITIARQTPVALAEALTSAVGHWRFQPLTRNGQAVPAHMVLPVRIMSGS
jgi:TonB family protein